MVERNTSPRRCSQALQLPDVSDAIVHMREVRSRLTIDLSPKNGAADVPAPPPALRGDHGLPTGSPDAVTGGQSDQSQVTR